VSGGSVVKLQAKPRWRVVLVVVVVVAAVAGVAWYFLFGSPSADERASAGAAADVAAKYTADRESAIDPQLPDDPEFLPTYPPGTTLTLDKSTWVQAENTGGAYAEVTPGGQRVLVNFLRLRGNWYISSIEAQ
jgi:hypothetical protein